MYLYTCMSIYIYMNNHCGAVFFQYGNIKHPHQVTKINAHKLAVSLSSTYSSYFRMIILPLQKLDDRSPKMGRAQPCPCHILCRLCVKLDLLQNSDTEFRKISCCLAARHCSCRYYLSDGFYPLVN